MISFFGFTVLLKHEVEKIQWQTVESTEELKLCREDAYRYRRDNLALAEQIDELRNEITSLGQILGERDRVISEQRARIDSFDVVRKERDNLYYHSQALKKENESLKSQLNAQTGYLKSISEPMIRMYAGNPSLVSPTLVHAVESLLASLDPHGRLRDD